MTRGIISAVGREITVADELTGRPRTLTELIRTDAAINPATAADRCSAVRQGSAVRAAYPSGMRALLEAP
ncbi:MAG: hypothetical protein ABI573_03600, partial [Chloroflexota bacterium]